MLIVDDLLVRPLFSILDVVRMLALKELYDVEETQNQLKENQLLFEIGERDRETYETRREELERELEMARFVRQQLDDRVEVRG